MGSLINRLNDVLCMVEAKNVGVLYHFTRGEALSGIINSRFHLKSGKAETEDRPSVCFTRHYNLHGEAGGGFGPIRLAVDGDTLSNHYKIQPHRDEQTLSKTHPSYKEYEEAVFGKRGSPGLRVDVGKHLRQIDVLSPLPHRTRRNIASDFAEKDEPIPNDYNEDYLKRKLEDAVEKHLGRHVPVNFVKSFKPYKEKT